MIAPGSAEAAPPLFSLQDDVAMIRVTQLLAAHRIKLDVVTLSDVFRSYRERFDRGALA
jgi:hypothetical protein